MRLTSGPVAELSAVDLAIVIDISVVHQELGQETNARESDHVCIARRFG